MSWLSEISRSLRGEALIRHVENRLYRNCEGQPRRPKRDDPHWTRRARALINQAGLSGRLIEIPVPPSHLSDNASGRGKIKGQPAGAHSPVSSAPGESGLITGARMVGNREGAGGFQPSPPTQVSAAPAGRRGGQSDNAAHPTQPGWTDDPEFWAPLMGTDEATPGEASEHGATSFSNAAIANRLKAQDHAA